MNIPTMSNRVMNGLKCSSKLSRVAKSDPTAKRSIHLHFQLGKSKFIRIYSFFFLPVCLLFIFFLLGDPVGYIVSGFISFHSRLGYGWAWLLGFVGCFSSWLGIFPFHYSLVGLLVGFLSIVLGVSGMCLFSFET